MTAAETAIEVDTVIVADIKTAADGIISLATDRGRLGAMEARVKIGSENLVSLYHFIHWVYLT